MGASKKVKSNYMTSLKEWLVNHIENNPGISFGTIWRDACLTRDMVFNSHDGSMFKAIGQLKSEGIIQETKRDNDTFYNLDQSFIRNRKINQIL